MINLGTQDITKFSVNNQFQVDTGNMWEYIRIINKSPYTVRANFGGAGTVDFPEMYLEDVFTGEGSGYNGVVQMYGVQQFTTAFIASAPSTMVTVIGYSKSDNHVPVAQPLTVLAAVGNTISVSSVQTLSNENGAVSQLVLDVGDVNFAQLITMFNDGHGAWNVDQSNVKHQVMLWSASGNPLILGQAGDTLPFNGAVTVAQTLTANGGINNNTFRDNTAGNLQLSLSNTTPQVLISNDLAITGTTEPNKPSVTVNGSVGGSCIFTDAVWGSGFKVETVFLNGWNSATVATHTFPSGITVGWYFSSFGSAQASPTWDLFIGSTAQTVRHMTGLGASNAAGTDNPETAIHSDNIGSFVLTGGAATSMQVGTVVGAVNGVLVIIGI